MQQSNATATLEKASGTATPPVTGEQAGHAPQVISEPQLQETPAPVPPRMLLVTAAGTQQPATPDASVANLAARTRPTAAVPESAIPEGLKFTGEATFPCNVRILGKVEGAIRAGANNTITIAPGGAIKGKATAQNLRIEGLADGEMCATGGLASFGAKAVCKGQVSYGRIAIEEGADIEASMKKIAAAA